MESLKLNLRDYEPFFITNQRDLLKVHEALSIFDSKFIPFPWSRKSWHTLNLNHYFLCILKSKDPDNIGSQEQRVIGLALFHTIQGDTVAHLLKIGLNPKFRGSEAATSLLMVCHDKLKNIGFEKVFLELQTSNKRALKFYKKLNFCETRCSKKYYQNGDDAQHMALNLIENS